MWKLCSFPFLFNATVLFAVVIVLSSAEIALAQSKRTNVWKFSDTGIDFNQTPPALLPRTEQLYYTYSSICDENGKLIFYTNGRTVWNANEEVVANGTGLDAHISNYYQQVIIVPHPAINDSYFIFTITDEFWYHTVLYHEVDFRSNRNGEVVSKNNLLGNEKLLVKISAIYVADENKYWVIVHGSLTNAFYSYLVDEQGVHLIPVRSETRTITGHFDYGQIKFSPNGDMVAVGNSIESDNVEIFKFDKKNGRLDNEILIPFLNDANSLEFSPDSRYLYVVAREVGCPASSNLMQFDLREWNTVNVIDSRKNIATDADMYGQLQLAPDGKIYMGNRKFDCTNNTYFHVINNPEQSGTGCNFQENAFSLNGSIAVYFLPNFYLDPCSSDRNSPKISLSLDTAYIIGTVFPEIKVNSSTSDFEWSDGYRDTARYFSDEGLYWIKAENECGTASDTVYVAKAKLFIPNIITPNNDGLNDSFIVQGTALFEIEWQLTVFNREGEAVFTSSNYQDDWDGGDISNGIYYYHLTSAKYGIEYKGWLHFIR